MEWRRLSATGIILSLLALAVLTSAALGRAADGQLPPGELSRSAEAGETTFRAKCISCHTLGGGNRPTGPDLAGVTERRERNWLVRFIREPDRMLAEGDPLARQLLAEFNALPMPNLKLSDRQIEDVLTYLAHPEEAQHHPAAAGTSQNGGADSRRGQALYVGNRGFTNGGAPCLACHGIAGLGLGKAAGASYGPDLTTMFENYEEEGVAAILESLPFPSMEPIYAKRPLTETERADLGAFLQEVSGRQPPQVGERLVLEAAGGAALLLVLAGIFGRRRLRGVRQPLVQQANHRQGDKS